MGRARIRMASARARGVAREVSAYSCAAHSMGVRAVMMPYRWTIMTLLYFSLWCLERKL